MANDFVDISPWMLFEATGDSEVDSSDAAGVSCTFVSPEFSDDRDRDDKRLHCMDQGGLADDDALSCSWDDHEGNRCADFDDSYVSQEGKRRNVDGEKDYGDRNILDGDDDDDEDDEGAVDQVRGGAAVVMNMFGRKKRKHCRNPAPESNNQRDTDRHFWEACLSS